MNCVEQTDGAEEEDSQETIFITGLQVPYGDDEVTG